MKIQLSTILKIRKIIIIIVSLCTVYFYNEDNFHYLLQDINTRSELCVTFSSFLYFMTMVTSVNCSEIMKYNCTILNIMTDIRSGMGKVHLR